MRSKRFVVLAAVVAILAITTIVVLWLTVWAKPTAADYKAAQAAISDVRATTQKLSDSLVAYNQAVLENAKTERSYDQLAAKTKASKDAYLKLASERAAKIEQLGTLKAMRDKDVKKAYEAFTAQNAKFTAYTDGYADSFARFRQSLSSCADIFNLGTPGNLAGYAIAHKAASTDCLADVDALAKTKSKPLADYGKKFAEIVRKRQTTFEEVAARKLTPDEGIANLRRYADDYNKMDPVTDLEKARKEASLTTQMDNLSRVVNDKLKQAASRLMTRLA